MCEHMQAYKWQIFRPLTLLSPFISNCILYYLFYLCLTEQGTSYLKRVSIRDGLDLFILLSVLLFFKPRTYLNTLQEQKKYFL